MLSAHRQTLLMVGLTLAALAIATPSRAETLITLFDLDNGVRPLAMGGAFTGLADDENALFYNPSGLAYLDHHTRFSSLYESYFGLTDYGQMAVARRGLGLGVILFNSRTIVQRDELGNQVGEFSYSAAGLAGAYATTLGELPLPLELPAGLDRLAVGARLKLYRVKTLEEGSGATLALDPAMSFDFGRLTAGGLEFEGLRLGLVLENLLGLPMEFGSGHREAWPLGFRFGGSVSVRGLVLAADLESNGAFHLGTEYRLSPALGLGGLEGGSLALRAGLMLGRRVSFSLGLGLQMRNFHIDYGMFTHAQLPLSHALSFGAAFNLDP
ncbi:MAG: hypothetical protein NUW06_06210 [Candidatus Acetothermia bacterium]|jgi:hypothetical protein|nr:hypothetical protein [Candidatus Acetothermia bacterium]